MRLTREGGTMIRDPRRLSEKLSGQWLAGLSFLIFGMLVLLLSLGWFAQIEIIPLSGGLAAMGGLFMLYALTRPAQRWAFWAGYVGINLAIFAFLGFAFRFQARPLVILAGLQAGLPFVVTYIYQVWMRRNRAYWWTLVPGAGLITFTLTVFQLSVGWPPHLVPGILVTTFMGLACGTFALIYFPNLDNAKFRWTLGPFIVTGIGAIWGLLLTIGVGFLIVPGVLLGFAAYFLLRAAITEWWTGLRQTRRMTRISIEAPGHPSLAATPAAGQLQAAAGITQPASGPGEVFPPDSPTERIEAAPGQDIQVVCSVFAPGEAIPQRFTCDGENLSPPLWWRNLPAQTRSVALICFDPDAPRGVFTHWLIYNLLSDVYSLPMGLPVTPQGAAQGTNDFGKVGYAGPCPPSGATHHYYFKLYALDIVLNLRPGADRATLVAAMEGHILATGQVIGTYARRPPQPPA
jgi:Raf kinase inhibitor-like YbhB/YbcL family protein